MVGTSKNVLVVTNGNREGLTGVGSFFIRPNAKAISTSSVYTDVSFGALSVNLLPSLTTVVKHVVVPALKAQVSSFSRPDAHPSHAAPAANTQYV